MTDGFSPFDWVEEPVGHERFGLSPPGTFESEVLVVISRSGGIGRATTLIANFLSILSYESGQHNLVVEMVRHDNIFTQCVLDPIDGMWIEVISNQFIEDVALQASPEGEQILAQLGFRPPVDGLPNHFQFLDRPVDFVEAAALLIAPLVLVWSLGDDDSLMLRMFPHVRAD